MDLIAKLLRKDLVFGLPKIKFEKDHLCSVCQQGKQTKTSFKSKSHISTTRPLQLLHMDLFGPSMTYVIVLLLLMIIQDLRGLCF